jgi:DNA end-binding protein Ku
VAPLNRGQKAYALLLQTLKKTGKAGLARVVISTKQHLAALVPDGEHLVLNLLRWAEEVREAPAGADVDESELSERELKMAEQLVNDMADAWSPGLFHDEFKEKLSELVQQKAKAGEMAQVTPLPGEDLPPSAEIIDLTELLRRSIKQHAPSAQRSARSAKMPIEEGAANDERPVRRSAAASRKKAAPKATAKVPAKPRKSA